MAHGPIYKVPLRRRREGKTNYYRRRDLLKSGKTRVIIRKTTKHIRVQFIDAFPDGDLTRIDSSTYQLKDYDWNISGGNIPAAYLSGYLAGKKALKAGIPEAITDLGLQRTSNGGRIYAALKGLIDAGVNIPVNDKVFPSDDILHGSHIKIISEHVKNEDAEEFKVRYARYQKNKVKPGNLEKLVKDTKGAIDKAF